jgi:nitric oxide dioxygenase
MLGTVRALASRHVGYGVADSHYDSVGQALLWTLERGLGESWTPQLAGAWTAAYTMLSQVMIAASHVAATPSPAASVAA